MEIFWITFIRKYFLEFIPKTNLNSIEYYLNNTLKNQKVSNNQEGSKVNSFVIPQFGNSTINNLNNNTLANIISQVEDEVPYNITEHSIPLGEEENIIKILKIMIIFKTKLMMYLI